MFWGTKRTATMAAALAFACGPVAGCGGSSGSPRTLPALSDTPGASTSSAPSPSPTASTKQQELAAATAVVRGYYALLNGLARSTDPQAFAAIETASCGCRKFVRRLSRLKMQGRHFFGAVHLTALRGSLDGPRSAQVLVTYNAGVGGIADTSGHVLQKAPPIHNASLDYKMTRINNKWLIYDVVILDAK